ncbi:uncharacterized protein ARMOST_01286 [Armillaria ostoyae]|uniref:F-box domain-containing protein n=1 Tax=Armillaria ostoyae TaxID=47428 RepID=A0A284QNN7_ARMOS|nr:uncharacterized protein ARMOST_01286 [Armillaria ostoyae]
MLVIFGYLKGCYTSLEACCFVCHAWRLLAQPLIFADLSLSHVHSWNRKFAAYPHFSGWVTHLDIWAGNRRELQILSSCRSLLDDPATLELICQLPNVKSLKVHGFFSLTKAAIEVLCHFPRLESLEICNVPFEQPEDLLGFTSQMVHLKNLTIDNIRIGGFHQNQSRRVGSVLHGHVDAVPKCLRSLNLQDVTQSLYILSWLSGSAFDLGGLTELRLSSRRSLTGRYREAPNFSPYVAPFLRTVGAGTKHLFLDMEMPGSCQPYEDNHMLNYYISTAALEGFTALETLDIRSESPHALNDASCLGDIQRLLHRVTFAKLCSGSSSSLKSMINIGIL